MFGLAPIKKEGMYSSFGHPSVEPWFGYHDDFNIYFNMEYGNKWYLRPFYKFLRGVALRSWDEALTKHAIASNYVRQFIDDNGM